MQRFVVVGSGLAGHRASVALRSRNRDAKIALIGAEPGLPYDRPPLTKDFLLGRRTRESLLLKDASSYDELGISHHPNTLVEHIDRSAQRVHAASGSLDYDALVLATGSAPRRLECVDADVSVHYLRTLDDATRLREQLLPGRHVAIIGGGFIGLEVAAAACMLGCRASVFEMSDSLLSRTMPGHFGRFILNLHRRKGVEILLDAAVKRVGKGARKGATIELSSGNVDADVVIIGIGVTPNVALAQDADLVVEDGIVVDHHCRTSDPAIYAVGEVTAHPIAGRGRRRRIESWYVAAEQPMVAAASICGDEATFDDPAWLWTDQFDFNFQAIGAPRDGVRYFLKRDHARNGWTLLCLDAAENLVGAVAANNGRDISSLRRIMRAGGSALDGLMEKAHEIGKDADISL